MQAANGNIVLAWTNANSSPTNIVFAVLNNSLGIVKGPTPIPNSSPRSDDSVSITRSKEWAVLTWLSSFGAFSGQPGFLYYALLDGSGKVVTPPMTFFSDCAGCSLSVPSNGQGNTPLLEATQVKGKVLNNQHQPIFKATVRPQSPTGDVAYTDRDGRYVLYLADTGRSDLTVARAGYGTLPAMLNLPTGNDMDDLDFVLPPETDLVVNGGWESGDLSGWNAEPGAAVAVTAVAHTGLGGLHLTAPPGDGSTPLWQLHQSVTLPAGLTQPTLSWFYRVDSGAPTDSLVVQVTNGTTEITRQFPLTPGGWTHAWADLSTLSGETVTLNIGFLEDGARDVYLDEISIGATRVGVYPCTLPLIAR